MSLIFQNGSYQKELIKSFEKSKNKKKKPKDITIPVDGTDPALPPVDLPPSLPKAIRIDQEEGTGNIKISSNKIE